MSEITNEFIKYPSITNVQNEQFLNKIRNMGIEAPWVVSEKIHGANFQIMINRDGENIRRGSRVRYIHDEETFFGQKEVVGRIEENVKSAAKELFIRQDTVVRVAFFGELFGGMYPHKNIPKNKKAVKVQNGIWYSSDNDWRCFDVMTEDFTGRHYFLNHKEFMELTSKYEIPIVPILAEGLTLEEALKVPSQFESEVYKFYGLPSIENNLAEGTVIKPEINYFIGCERVILKNKIEKFREITKKVQKEQAIMEEEILEVVNGIKEYLTENRLDNVISHGIEVIPSNIGTLIKELWTDAVDEYDKDSMSKFSKLDKEQQHRVNKFLNKTAANIVLKKVRERLYE